MNTGDVIAGKYRVVKRLGHGGMGLVVLAEHVHLGEHVAIKVMSGVGAGSPEASARFLREARSAAKLKGEHVARATDFGILDSGAPYIVLEYLEGEDLGATLRRLGRVVTPEAVGYLLQACEGIAEAHGAGIIHRDLKPTNLFLTKRPDGSALIKVLDFGIAKSTQPLSGTTSGLTGTGAMMGSPTYMSPEQLKSSKDVGPTADVWGLAVVLFELLTGKQPFNGETFPAIAGAILYVPSPDPCAERQAIPRALGDVVLKGLAKEPEDRFQSVGELARALAPFANDDAQIHALRTTRILREDGGVQRPSLPSLPPGLETGAHVDPARGGPARVLHGDRSSSVPAFGTPVHGVAQAASFAPSNSPAGRPAILPYKAAVWAHDPVGSSTTTSGQVHLGNTSGPTATRRSMLPIALACLAVFGLGIAGVAAVRHQKGSGGVTPEVPSTPDPAWSARAHVQEGPAQDLPAPAPTPPTPTLPSAQVAVRSLPVAKPAVPSAPAPAMPATPATPAMPAATAKPSKPSTTPSPSAAPLPDCSSPTVTDPKTGEIRVKPGCR